MVDFGLGALGEDVGVGGATIATVHVLHLDGDTEHLGQHDDVDVVALLAHGLHLMLAEVLDGPPTLNEVLKELALPLLVVQGEQNYVIGQIISQGQK